MPTEPKPPRVLLSYAHEPGNPRHGDQVLALADRLRADGVDAILDQYEPNPPEGWPRWMERQMREADFVLVVCTETYARRVTGQEEAGTGLGARWEGGLIYNDFYRTGAVSAKFVPVLRRPEDQASIPAPLQGVTFYTLPAGYETLYRFLTGQPETPRPAIGARQALPPRPRRADFRAEGGPPPDTGFSRYYTKSLAEAIYLTHYLPEYDREELEEALRTILKLIRAVTAAYYGDKRDLKINANVMVAAPVSSDRAADYPGLCFTGPTFRPRSYQAILTLRQWATLSRRPPRPLALPVHKNRVSLLFGAPLAYATGQVQAVGDTHSRAELAQLLASQPAAIAEEIQAYMAKAPFRSFVCWQLPFREKPIGVLNVQSSAPDIFGDGNQYKDAINGYIRPFCYVLGLVLAALDSKSRIIVP